MDWLESVDWGEVVAIAIAALALGWQVFRWWRDREPGLEVEIAWAHAMGPIEDGATVQPHTAASRSA